MANYDISGLRVLVVDDHEPMRVILRRVLRALGLREIKEADSGDMALKILESTQIDLIITDNLMESMDGIELVRKIRAGEHGADPFAAIIMVSGQLSMDRIVEARDAGINEFLAKPISAKLVYMRICAVIENPRPFIRTGQYFGPDRRRRQLDFHGEDGRQVAYEYSAHLREFDR
ncbi:MAG: response regulator [Alphaproteobacteria bacterium]